MRAGARVGGWVGGAGAPAWVGPPRVPACRHIAVRLLTPPPPPPPLPTPPRARFLISSTSEVYGDPLEHPQARHRLLHSCSLPFSSPPSLRLSLVPSLLSRPPTAPTHPPARPAPSPGCAALVRARACSAPPPSRRTHRATALPPPPLSHPLPPPLPPPTHTDRDLLGQRQLHRRAQLLRRGQARRRDADHGLPPRARAGGARAGGWVGGAGLLSCFLVCAAETLTVDWHRKHGLEVRAQGGGALQGRLRSRSPSRRRPRRRPRPPLPRTTPPAPPPSQHLPPLARCCYCCLPLQVRTVHIFNTFRPVTPPSPPLPSHTHTPSPARSCRCALCASSTPMAPAWRWTTAASCPTLCPRREVFPLLRCLLCLVALFVVFFGWFWLPPPAPRPGTTPSLPPPHRAHTHARARASHAGAQGRAADAVRRRQADALLPIRHRPHPR